MTWPRPVIACSWLGPSDVVLLRAGVGAGTDDAATVAVPDAAFG
jgi:hypothetical protein